MSTPGKQDREGLSHVQRDVLLSARRELVRARDLGHRGTATGRRIRELIDDVDRFLDEDADRTI